MNKSKPRFRVGDWALHKSGRLDDRRVVEVSPGGGSIRLDILGTPTDWLLASDYVRKGA